MKGGSKEHTSREGRRGEKRWIREQKVMIKRKMKAEKITLNLEENLEEKKRPIKKFIFDKRNSKEVKRKGG